MSRQMLTADKSEAYDKAKKLHDQMHLKEAEGLYRDLLGENDNENHLVLYQLGIICLQTGRYKEAQGLLKRAAKVDPGSVDVFNNLGTAYFYNGQEDEAKEVYEKALQINPNHPYVLNNLANLMKNKKQVKEAERLFQKAICFKRDYVDAHNNLGMLYNDLGRTEEAIGKFQEALRLDPGYANAYNSLGNAYKDQGKRDEAEECFRKAIECDPGHGDAYNNLGNMLRARVKLDEAQHCFEKALEINPDHHMALYNLMMLMEFSHKLDKADDLLQKLKAKDPSHPAVTLLSARLARRTGRIEEGIKVIEESTVKDAQIGMYIQFELGQLYDRAEKSEQAFAAFKRANSLHSKSTEARYVDKMAYPDMITANKARFTKEWVKSWTPTPQSKEYPTPIFIIGFPRSGTTLLDQILFSHPDFFVAEERPAVEKLRYDLQLKYGNYTDCLADLTADEIEAMRKSFYETHNEYEEWDGKGYFVDKFPLNIALIGIIYRIFPDAKFIFALRHPCDCVLSCFMQQFQLNPGMIHFLDLESSARFYDQVMDLWFHFQEVLPLNSYTHRYEDVVENFRDNIARLLDFLDVPWNDAVLEYDKMAKKRKSLANTPSYSQITEKIYTRARYRWERYREQMEPVLDILLPYARKFGYPEE